MMYTQVANAGLALLTPTYSGLTTTVAGKYLKGPGVQYSANAARYNGSFAWQNKTYPIAGYAQPAANLATYATTTLINSGNPSLMGAGLMAWVAIEGIQYLNGEWQVTEEQVTEPNLRQFLEANNISLNQCAGYAACWPLPAYSVSGSQCTAYMSAYNICIGTAGNHFPQCGYVGGNVIGSVNGVNHCLHAVSPVTQQNSPATDADWQRLAVLPLPDHAIQDIIDNTPDGLPIQSPQYEPEDLPITDPYFAPDGSQQQQRLKVNPQADGQVSVEPYTKTIADPQGNPIS